MWPHMTTLLRFYTWASSVRLILFLLGPQWSKLFGDLRNSDHRLTRNSKQRLACFCIMRPRLLAVWVTATASNVPNKLVATGKQFKCHFSRDPQAGHSWYLILWSSWPLYGTLISLQCHCKQASRMPEEVLLCLPNLMTGLGITDPVNRMHYIPCCAIITA